MNSADARPEDAYITVYTDGVGRATKQGKLGKELRHMTKQLTVWDSAELLRDEEDAAAYLNAALEDGDAEQLIVALGDIARARGMTQVARDAGVTRDGLYKALSVTGNPAFTTIVRVMNSLGLSLTAKVKRDPRIPEPVLI
jgi:probable addiction module antidote protein